MNFLSLPNRAMNSEKADYFVKEYQKWLSKPLDESLLKTLSEKIDEAHANWASLVEDWVLLDEQQKKVEKDKAFRTQLHYHKLMGEMSFALLNDENCAKPALIPAVQDTLLGVNLATNVQTITEHFEQPTTPMLSELLEPLMKKSVMNQATRASLTKLKEMLESAMKRHGEFALNQAALDPIVAYLGYRLLDEPTKIVIKMMKENEQCGVQDLVQIIEKRMSIMAEPLDVEMFELPPVVQKTAMSGQLNDPQQSTSQQHDSNEHHESKSTRPFCYFCGKPHWLQGCEAFRQLHWADRAIHVLAMPICSNCFRDTHTVAMCTDGKCMMCKMAHNSLLCPQSPKNNPEQKN